MNKGLISILATFAFAGAGGYWVQLQSVQAQVLVEAAEAAVVPARSGLVDVVVPASLSAEAE